MVTELGPTATFTGSTSLPVNFTTEGSYAWVYYPGTTNNSPASPPYQKSSASIAFSPLVGLTPTGTTTVGSSRTGGLGSGVTASVTTTDSASTNLTNLPGYTYASTSSSLTGYGMESTYTMPANSVQTLSIYCYTLNGLFGEMKLTDAGVVTPLYDDGSSGVQLPVSSAAPTKDGGVYRFTLQNSDNASHVLTFAYTVAAYPSGQTGGQIGFEGATVSTVPEPTAATAMGISTLGLLLRRRRQPARSSWPCTKRKA